MHCPCCEKRVAKLLKGMGGYFCRACLGNPLYASQAKYAEAVAIYRRLVNAVRAKEGPDVLNAMVNLALTKTRRGKLEEAERLEEQVLELRKRIGDKEGPEVLTLVTSPVREKLVSAA